MEFKTTKHPDRLRSSSVLQPSPHETCHEAIYYDVSSSAKLDLMIELRSKSLHISIRQMPDVFGGVRQEEARSIYGNENWLTVKYRNLSLQRPVSELSNVTKFRCDVQSIGGRKAQSIRASIHDRGSCMYDPLEYTGNRKRRVSHIKTNEFHPAIHPIGSDLPSPSPLEL